MQLPDSPQLRAKIARAREYGDRIKALSATHNTQVERIFRRHLTLLKSALASGGSTAAILDSLLSSLRELLEALISGSAQVACEREEADSDTQLALLLATISMCDISYYEDTLTRYRNILDDEVRFAIEGGYTADIDLFLLNPMAYMSGKKNGLQDLKEDIGDVSKGVSYSFAENMKKLGISVAALVYANAEFELWRNMGDIEGYMGVRNSSYPCALCDSWAHVFVPMSQGMIYPLHNRCVCSIIPLRQSELP